MTDSARLQQWVQPIPSMSTISFSATSVAVDQEKTITISAKRGTDAVEGVKLNYSIADGTIIEFVRWGGGDMTDAAGEAKIVIKGKAVGASNLTISQVAGTYKTSGLSDAKEITVTAE